MMRRGINYIADAAEAKEIDRISIQDIGIPSMVLMEKAAMAMAGCIMAQSSPGVDRILAVCGTGNNGGDGVAASRILRESGYDVAVLIVGQIEKCSEEMECQMGIARRMSIPVYQAASVTEEKLQKYTIIIDAIFGIGLCRDITGIQRRWIEWINASSAKVIAADIPSGIHAGTGAVLGTAVQADVTVTFGVNKRGIVLNPGMQYAGKVIVTDIGFPKQAVRQVSPKAYTYDAKKIYSLLPKRKIRSHKGSYGRVLVMAGSPQMSGACYFASEAAYRVGAGLVHVVTAKENADIIRTKLPEAIVSTWSSDLTEEEIAMIIQGMDLANAVVIGPGLGLGQEAQAILRLVLDHLVKEGNTSSDASHKPVVIDADGLNLLAQMEEWFAEDSHDGRRLCLPDHVILTPHLKEMSRLIQKEVPVIMDHMIETVYEREGKCTIVLKDARTVVSDGEQVYINTTGNHALAKGGSGDVLSGMIGGLLAQGMKPMEAASLAVCLHGMTAEAYVQEKGAYTMLASDILQEIPKVMKGEIS